MSSRVSSRTLNASPASAAGDAVLGQSETGCIPVVDSRGNERCMPADVMRIACNVMDKVGSQAGVLILEQTSMEIKLQAKYLEYEAGSVIMMTGSGVMDPAVSYHKTPLIDASLKMYEGISLGDNPTVETVQGILDNENYNPIFDVKGVMLRVATRYIFGYNKTIFLDVNTLNDNLNSARYTNTEISSEPVQAVCMKPYAVSIPLR